MDLHDRINEEMVSEPESALEAHFDEAKQLFNIYSDGTININDVYADAPIEQQLLILLIAQRYAYTGERVESPTLPYKLFYSRIDADDSTIRKKMNALQDAAIVNKEEETKEWYLIPDALPKAIARIDTETA